MFLRNYKFKLKELDLQYKVHKQKLDTDLLNYERNILARMSDLEKRCAIDTASYEHDFHFAKEEKKSELAKLDALILARTETSNNDKVVYERIIDMKDKEIITLNETINKLIQALEKKQEVINTVNK